MFPFRLVFALMGYLVSMLLDTEGAGAGAGGDTTGQAPPDPPAGGGQDDPPTTGGEAQPYRVIRTQDEWESLFGPTRQEGRDALLNRLGVQDEAEAERLVNEQREIQRQAESEVETAQREKEEAEQEAQRLRDEVDQEREARQRFIRRQAARDELRAQSVRPERLERALGELDLSQIQLDENEDATGADALVTKHKSETPEWYTEVQEAPVPETQGGRGVTTGDGEGRPAGRWLDRSTGTKRRGTR